MRSAGVSSGHPRVAKGQMPLENQVSSTSGSCFTSVLAHFEHCFRVSSRVTSMFPHAWQKNAGIW